MAKKQKAVPLTPDEVEALTTTEHLQRARYARNYWLGRSDAILKLAHPTPGQLEAQPWHEQHGLIWGAIAEKLDRLEELEAQQRAREYEASQKSPAGEC